MTQQDGLGGPFVAARDARTTFDHHVPAPIFRVSFTLDEVAEDAEVVIGAPGFYRLFLNGEEITKGHLAPYIANPDDLVYFDRYDLADRLVDGENVIGVMLGDGFQNMIDTVWDFDKARHHGAPRFAFRFSAGDTHLDATAFRWSDSEVTFNSYRCGVHVDARRIQAGWTRPGFDDADWHAVRIAESPRGEYRLCDAEPIRVRREIAPVSVTQGRLLTSPPRPDVANALRDVDVIPVPIDREQGYLYDYGVNTAGIFRLKIKGEPGQRIVIQVAERLTDGAADPTNISFFYPEGYGQRDVYICRGGDEEIFIPPFVYHGGRYLYVSGIREDQATPELLTFLEMHSDLRARATFRCSDATVNRLWELAHHSDLTNFHYFPTDCPHREKNGWTGDASMSAEHMIFTLRAERSFTEWMRSIVKAQRDDGALPGIVPTTGWGYDWGNGPAWDSVLFNLPYMVYRYTGETEILKIAAPAMLRYLSYIAGRRDARGIVAVGLGDWCPVGAEADDYLVPLGFTDSVMVLDMCRKAEMMFTVLDRPFDADYARRLGDAMRRAVRDVYVDLATMTVTGHSQSGQALGLYYRIFEPGERAAALERLLAFIREDGGSMNVGFLGGRVIFHVLAEAGYADLALHMVAKEDFPSYGYILTRGATSLWEMILPAPERSGSENHHFWGDISHWFLRHLAGLHVNPEGNDPNRLSLRPQFVQALDHVEASFEAPDGRIDVRWTREGEAVELEVTTEGALRYDVRLPDGFYFEDTDRSYHATIDGTGDTVTHRWHLVTRRARLGLD